MNGRLDCVRFSGDCFAESRPGQGRKREPQKSNISGADYVKSGGVGCFIYTVYIDGVFLKQIPILRRKNKGSGEAEFSWRFILNSVSGNFSFVVGLNFRWPIHVVIAPDTTAQKAILSRRKAAFK